MADFRSNMLVIHTSDHEVVELIALSIEILFHAGDVCIGDVLLTEELRKDSQHKHG